ncbi:hypothetical protein B0H14DRAFT_3165866 [Mycena olivaceomarginata]|nr:hypothetical protein B0H14DRAFT_3165866 [Mycena olivaceomarginata]
MFPGEVDLRIIRLLLSFAELDNFLVLLGDSLGPQEWEITLVSLGDSDYWCRLRNTVWHISILDTLRLRQYPPSSPPRPPTTASPLPPTQSRFTPQLPHATALLQCMQPRSLEPAPASQSIASRRSSPRAARPYLDSRAIPMCFPTTHGVREGAPTPRCSSADVAAALGSSRQHTGGWCVARADITYPSIHPSGFESLFFGVGRSTGVSIACSSRYAPSIAPSFAFDPIPPMTTAPPLPTTNGVTYPQFIYECNTVPVESTIGDTSSAYSYPAPRDSKGKGKAPAHARELSTASGLAAVRELAGQFPVPRPLPIPGAAPYARQREWDAERGGDPQHEAEEEVYRYAYDGPVSSPKNELPQQAHTPHPYADAAAYGAAMHSPPRVNDAYSPPSDGNAYAEYTRANPYSPPQQYAAFGNGNGNSQTQNETRHRNGRSDTTLGTTPRTYASLRFDGNKTSTLNTEGSVSGSDPFRFDVALDTGMFGKAAAYRAQQRQQSSDGELEYAEEEEQYSFPQEGQGVPEEVLLDDGPHLDYKGHTHNASVGTRTSAALLQMTQRPAADWAPVEFSPSVFNASTPATPALSAGRNKLTKKRPSVKSERSDVPASSWLHGDGMLHDELADADGEGVPPMPLGGNSAGFARVKSIGRVRAPRKATPRAGVDEARAHARGACTSSRSRSRRWRTAPRCRSCRAGAALIAITASLWLGTGFETGSLFRRDASVSGAVAC